MNLPVDSTPRRQWSVVMFSFGKLDIDRFALRHAEHRLRIIALKRNRASVETNVSLEGGSRR